MYDRHNRFTKCYNCKLLVYHEQYANMYAAITREKEIKGSSRKKKSRLIESINPEWLDLYDSLLYLLSKFLEIASSAKSRFAMMIYATMPKHKNSIF